LDTYGNYRVPYVIIYSSDPAFEDEYGKDNPGIVKIFIDKAPCLENRLELVKIERISDENIWTKILPVVKEVIDLN
jgi:hypothetical protein